MIGPPAERDEVTAPFFDAAARDELLIRRCRPCTHPEPPEARTCGVCGAVELDWVPASGRARLVTWTVVHRAPHPDFAGAVPYVAGVVELEEGPWLHTRILDDPAPLRAEAAMRVAFVHPEQGESIPAFTLD
jgi:uncharacterized OB-fold protein